MYRRPCCWTSTSPCSIRAWRTTTRSSVSTPRCARLKPVTCPGCCRKRCSRAAATKASPISPRATIAHAPFRAVADAAPRYIGMNALDRERAYQRAKRSPAMAVYDITLWDLAGRYLGQPVYKLWGLDVDRIPPSDYTIGIDTVDKMVAKLQEVPGWPVYKIKLGTLDAVIVWDAVAAYFADDADNQRAASAWGVKASVVLR